MFEAEFSSRSSNTNRSIILNFGKTKPCPFEWTLRHGFNFLPPFRCTTSARLICSQDLSLLRRFMVNSLTLFCRGVLLGSSGRRFPSSRSMNIRLVPWNLPLSPGDCRLSFGRVPDALISQSTEYACIKIINLVIQILAAK